MATISKCVPVASTSRDSDALAAAVGTSNVSYNDSGLLCAIDNYPANGVQNCGEAVGNGTYDYWSYWHGASGTWVYASDGPTEQPVASPPDDVVGLRYQTNGSDNPGNPPPSPSVAPSYADICNASTEVAPVPDDVVVGDHHHDDHVAIGDTRRREVRRPDPAGVRPRREPDRRRRQRAARSEPRPPRRPPHSRSRARGMPARARAGLRGPPARATPSAALHKPSGGGGNPVLPVVLVVIVVAGLGGLALIRWRRKPADG